MAAGKYARIYFDYTQAWKIDSNSIMIYSHGTASAMYHLPTLGGWQFRKINNGTDIGELDFSAPDLLSNIYTRSSRHKCKLE